MNLRADQTVTFTVDWKDSLGNSVAAPEGVTPFDDNPNYVKVEDLGGGVYKVTPLGLSPESRVGVQAPAGFAALDTVAIEGGVAVSGTVVWGTPEPA